MRRTVSAELEAHAQVQAQARRAEAEAGGGEEPEPQVDAVHGTTQVFSLYTTVNKAP